MDLPTLVTVACGGRSYAEVARASGLSRSAVQKIATGQTGRIPDATTLDGLAKGLNLPVTLVRRAAAVSAGLLEDDEPTGLDSQTRQVVAYLQTATESERSLAVRVLRAVLPFPSPPRSPMTE